MPFSATVMDAIRKEATALGLRSPSAISVALREQLVDEKTGNMDGRAKAYWVAGQVIHKGVATPLPGVLQITGLDALSGLAVSASQFVGLDAPATDCLKHVVGSLRVSLTRTNMGHAVAVLPASRQPPDPPDSWVDLFVCKTQADAVGKAATLKPGKVF